MVTLNMNTEALLTYDEARELCGLKTKRPLQVAVKRRELQVVHFGYRNVRFERRELQRWIDSKKNRIIRGL
jgi:predicted DNA-binding transcriptional regulator AlpA